MREQGFWRRRPGGYVPVRVVGTGPAGVSIIGTDRTGERFTETVDRETLRRDTSRAEWVPELKELLRALLLAIPVAAAFGVFIYAIGPAMH